MKKSYMLDRIQRYCDSHDMYYVLENYLWLYRRNHKLENSDFIVSVGSVTQVYHELFG